MGLRGATGAAVIAGLTPSWSSALADDLGWADPLAPRSDDPHDREGRPSTLLEFPGAASLGISLAPAGGITGAGRATPIACLSASSSTTLRDRVR
jgi:hypothetical protein